MSKNLQAAIDFFISRPKLLERSTGKFIAGVHGGKLFKHFSREQVQSAKDKAREFLHQQELNHLQNIIAEQEDAINRKFNSKGECDLDGVVKGRIKTLEDLIKACHIDTKIWEVESWECTKWEVGRKDKQLDWNIKDGVATGTSKDSGKIFVEPLFRVKAKLVKLKAATVFKNEFQKFLSTYEPEVKVEVNQTVSPIPKENAILILPKQDAHFNRVDAKGRNDIFKRFKEVEEATVSIVKEAYALNSLQKITYIIGSDQFNSEWNSLTTGGTPQENLVGYKAGFKLVCDHEISIIEHLLQHAKEVELLFVPGNHDEYAGWHMIEWLKCHYRNESRIIVRDETPENQEDHRKYERFSNAAIMYDHGASLNGAELAQRFPLEFKNEWSKCDYYYIFSGDKHHELSKDIQGIKYFRVPALTATKSRWEHRKGYLSKGEIQAFLIKDKKGLTNMYSRMLE
jgi:hypothetical protein